MSCHTTLQGRGATALHLLEEVLTFQQKLTDLAPELQRHTVSLPLFKRIQTSSQADQSTVFAVCNHQNACIVFREEKTTLSFPVTPLNTNPSLLNVTAST